MTLRTIFLLAALLPAMGAIKNKAKVAECKAIFGALDTGIQSYRAEQAIGASLPPTSAASITPDAICPSASPAASAPAVHAVEIEYAGPAQEASPEAAEKRRAEAERAARQARRDSAISFASSFSGKWGDYDPEGMEGWEEEKGDEEDKK